VLGTIAAAFVYSLFSSKISILAIGFGSTIISFTVDYGIAYLLFLDRPFETLVSTMLSLRTKDAVTELPPAALLSRAQTPESILFWTRVQYILAFTMFQYPAL
jgi:endonuclease III